MEHFASDWDAIELYEAPDVYTVSECSGGLPLSNYADDLASLRTRQAHGSFIHEVPWLSAIQSELRQDKLTVYLVFSGQQLVAALPLETKKSGFWPLKSHAITFPDDSNIYLNDILIDDRHSNEPIMRAVLDHISESGFSWDLCVFGKLTESALACEAIEQLSPDCRETGSSAWIPCKTPSDLKLISKKVWKNTTRLANKVRRDIGEVVLEQSTPGDAQHQHFSHFLRIESSGWKGAAGTATSVADDHRARQFFGRLLLDYADDWNARVFTLRFGGKPAATALAVRCGSTWNLLKIGYDEQFREYGPGSILLQSFLKKMSEDESVTQTSLVTSPDWAARWHFNQTPIREYSVYAPSVRGKLLRLYFRVRLAAAKLKNRISSRHLSSQGK